jgi:hypothetical protein
VSTSFCSFSMKTNINTVFGLTKSSVKVHSNRSSHLRQSQPCWHPSSHQEGWAFRPQRLAEDFPDALKPRQRAYFCLLFFFFFPKPTDLFPLGLDELCNRLFKTSAGAQTVVATVPAASDASICTRGPSSSFVDRICDLAAPYLVTC